MVSFDESPETAIVLVFLRPQKDVFGLFRLFIISYAEFFFFTHTDVYNSVNWVPNLRMLKIDETVSKSQNEVPVCHVKCWPRLVILETILVSVQMFEIKAA